MGELSLLNRGVIGVLVVLIMTAAVRSVRNRQLSLSTGVIWLGGGCLALLTLAFPRILILVTEVIGAKYPASALTLYALLFFATMLVVLGAKLERMVIQLTQIERAIALADRRLRNLELENSTVKEVSLKSH